ncbi:MAG: hypothetical protein IKE91_06185 [Clostridia bacterium]|nr:hypothetical protein [bacterium]MBR2705037.1 hypothetical protein [Clostridia bacterium]
MKTFEINNHIWNIYEVDEKLILEEYQKRQPNAYSCMGLTFYKEHKIWIAEDMCEDEKVRTLKHELTHCYIWENGFYNVDFNNEELVCDFVASIYDFIKNVLDKENK